MAELTFGYSWMAAIRARTANGRGDSEAPSRSLNSSLARSRSRMTLVMSISTALVSWALVWREATIRSAITLRSRVAGTTSSRRPLVRGTATRGGADGAAAAALPLASPAGALAAAGSWPRCCTYASTSSRRTRPPEPLPWTWLRSTSCSRASRRTSGDTPAAALPLPDRAAALSSLGSSAACSASAPAPSSAVSSSALGSSSVASAVASPAGPLSASASPPPPPPITASSAPTSTVSSAWTLMDWSTPDTGEGTSVSTLSVEISNSGSSASTWSPSCLSQRVMVPSVIDSPSSGMVTVVVLPSPEAPASGRSAGSCSASAPSSVFSSALASPPPSAVAAASRSSSVPASSLPSSGWAASSASCSPPASSCSWSASACSPSSPPPSPPASPSCSMMASSAPTSTVSSAWTLMVFRTPATGDGTSVSTLSVDTSNRGSSASTRSPSCLIHRVIVPSVIDSPSSGILTGVAIDHRLPGLLAGSELVEAASGERHVGLADGFGQGRVGVDELGDVDRQSLPVVDQHRLGDQVGDPGPDQVDPEHRAVLGGNDLDHAPQAVDQALGGGVERELVDDHLVALVLGLGLGQTDRRHLGGGEGDPRDAGVVDRRGGLA